MADAQRQLEIVVSAKDNASKTIDKIGSIAGGAFKIVTAAAATAGAAVAAFAVKSVLEFSSTGDAVEKMAERTGLAAESVSALRVAADASGTSIETVEGAVKKMQLNMAKAADGTTNLDGVLKALHISAKDFVASSPAQQFETLGNAISKVGDTTERTVLSVQAFGKSGTDLLPLFQDGTFSMAEWSKKAQELGVSFTDVAANNAAALNDALGELKMAFSGLSLEVGTRLAPIVTDFINNRIVPLLPKLQELVGQGFELVSKAIGFVTQKVSELWAWLAQIGVIDAMSAAFSRLWDVLQNSVWPAIKNVWDALQPYMPFLGALAAFLGATLLFAFTAIVNVLALLLNALSAVVSTIADLVKWVGVNAQPVLNAMKNIVDGLTGSWKGLTDSIGKAVDILSSWISKAKQAAQYAGSGILSGISNAVGGAVKAITGGKASGGPVQAGQSYLVGEHGTELFTPSASGYITPNNRLGGVSVNVNVSVGSVANSIDMRRLADLVGDAVLGKVLANQRV